MTDDSYPRVSSFISDSSTTKQRKKRKWDQPDESLVSAGVAVPRIFPLATVGALAKITLPTVSSATCASLAIPLSTFNTSPLQLVQVPLQQHATAIVQKLVQPKIQDELIAREIVINDADSAIRYKLTRRQTQEEIQKITGAVVIIRGKYRPPNAPVDGEKPLYLHISAAAHLETTAERIKAVDHAAAMVEDMLKQATVSSGVKVDHLLSTCVFLGFQPDPTLDIISRIRGPNDQYVNHIMNETGATVLIRGRASGYPENRQTEETPQPLHLLLSSNNAKSLEHAKILAENLLDTICCECGASSVLSQGPLSHSIKLPNPGLPQAKPACYPQGLTSVTSYNGYGGIYPQATPLQQVALALRQSTAPITAPVAPATTAASTDAQTEPPYFVKDKHLQKRKFHELPAAVKGLANLNQKSIQGSEFSMPGELTSHVGARDISTVRDRKSFVKPSSNEMPPPPPRILPLPSCLPKFSSTPKVHCKNNGIHGSKSEAVPDTLIKLMEYGDDDDDDDDDIEETAKVPLGGNHSTSPTMPKPFWAV